MRFLHKLFQNSDQGDVVNFQEVSMVKLFPGKLVRLPPQFQLTKSQLHIYIKNTTNIQKCLKMLNFFSKNIKYVYNILLFCQLSSWNHQDNSFYFPSIFHMPTFSLLFNACLHFLLITIDPISQYSQSDPSKNSLNLITRPS